MRVMMKILRNDAVAIIEAMKAAGFIYDHQFGQINLHSQPGMTMVRGEAPKAKLDELRKIPGVVGVWLDIKSEPMSP
jgi:hypothetical protein